MQTPTKKGPWASLLAVLWHLIVMRTSVHDVFSDPLSVSLSSSPTLRPEGFKPTNGLQAADTVQSSSLTRNPKVWIIMYGQSVGISSLLHIAMLCLPLSLPPSPPSLSFCLSLCLCSPPASADSFKSADVLIMVQSLHKQVEKEFLSSLISSKWDDQGMSRVVDSKWQHSSPPAAQ